MLVEILLEVLSTAHSHSLIEACKVLVLGHLAFLELPAHASTGWPLLNHLIIVVDLEELVDNFLVVRHLSVVQLVNALHNLVDLLAKFSGAHPELALRILKTLGLDFFNLNDRVVTLLPPFKFLIKEVKHGEVKTPHVISSRQIDIIVRV